MARMAFRPGARTTRMLEAIAADPRQGAHTCRCEPVCEAEVRYAAKAELTTRLVDVRRRTRLGMGACGGTRCLARASQLLAEERALSPAAQLVELGDAMTARFIGRRPVLEGANLATEELNQAIHFLAGNLAPFLRAAREQLPWTHAVPGSVAADAPATRRGASKPAELVMPPPVPDRA